MIYRLLRKAVEPELAQAAMEEMRASWQSVPNFERGLSVICYLREGLRPAGSVRPEFRCGPAVSGLKEAVESLLDAQFPMEFARQRFARIHPGPGEWEAFTTITVNRNWATPLHRDTGTLPHSIVALLVVKVGEVYCPTEFHDPESEWVWEEELEAGDLALFQGAEMEHGNPRGITGPGERWAFVFYRG